jgi:hypothetical protein
LSGARWAPPWGAQRLALQQQLQQLLPLPRLLLLLLLLHELPLLCGLPAALPLLLLLLPAQRLGAQGEAW